MILQIKIYLISILYLFGAIYILFFPPRNFELSGAKIRTVRSVGVNLKFPYYITDKTLQVEVTRLASDDKEIARTVRLKPETYENRSIVALELHSDKQTKKLGILVVGGLLVTFVPFWAMVTSDASKYPYWNHVMDTINIIGLNGMAWGTPNAILELAHKLLYDANYQTPFFNDYDWYLIPMGNPDGIQFTHSMRDFAPVDPLMWSENVTARNWTRPKHWHKNVDKEESDKKPCFGTNVNRNFAYHWQDGIHKPPCRCSQYYPGPKPFSTNEAQALRKYIDELGGKVHLAIHLHASFVPKKEYILYPWRYSVRTPSNYRTLQDIGEYAARQARLPDGRLYEVHQSSSDGIIAGSLSDYLSGVVGIELVFLIKPYHQPYTNATDTDALETYVKKSLSTILSLVRGWRSSTKQNTLSFFGRDVEF